METFKMFLLRMWHYLIFIVQDFDGLKMKLHLANDSYDSYYNRGDDIHYVGLKKLEGDWVVLDIGHSIHHNPSIVVMQPNRLTGEDWILKAKLADIIA